MDFFKCMIYFKANLEVISMIILTSIWWSFTFYFNVAPGSYDVEKADKKIHESSPAFSLGVKYKEPKPEEIPGNTQSSSKNVYYS